MFLLKALTFGPFVPSFYKNDVNKVPGKKTVIAAILYSFFISGLITIVLIAGVVFIKLWLPTFQGNLKNYVSSLNFTYIGVDADYNLDTDLQPQPFVDDLGYDMVLYIDKNSTDSRSLLENGYKKDAILALLKDRVVAKDSDSIKLEEAFYKDLIISALGNSESMSLEEKEAALDTFEGVKITKSDLLNLLSKDFNSLIPSNTRNTVRIIIIISIFTLFILFFMGTLLGLFINAFIFAIIIALVNKWTVRHSMKFSLIGAIGFSILSFVLKVLLGSGGSILAWIIMVALIIYSLKSLKTSTIVAKK